MEELNGAGCSKLKNMGLGTERDIFHIQHVQENTS
jgi:hypothetical protein